MTRKYCKLVRDGIPGVIQNEGSKSTFILIKENDLEIAVADKLVEEALEYRASPNLEELADLYAIVEKASEKFGGLEKVRMAATRKEKKRGGFGLGVFLLFAEGENLP